MGTLFNRASDISVFGDSLITLDFRLSQLGVDVVFAHDPVINFIQGQELSIGSTSPG